MHNTITDYVWLEDTIIKHASVIYKNVFFIFPSILH